MSKVSAQKNAAQRYTIDAKRGGVNLESDEAGAYARESIRTDSTYYVGWLFDGGYKYNRAADFLGFRMAAAPLEKALTLLERDFRRELGTRTQDVMTYINEYKYHFDYAIITQYLVQCYQNTEEPQKTYALLRHYARWNFQRDFFDAYNYMMWVTHRARFYTNERYPFLRNSIDENEALAGRYLDTSLRRIARAQAYNAAFFAPGSYAADYLGVYHYKAILHSYAFRTDSAQRYYDLLREGGQPSHNNYGSFRGTLADFRTAEEEYAMAAMSDGRDKRLQEWAYYSSILDLYKGKPKAGIQLSKDMIRAAGSTPGYGWYNIALARALLYDGQMNEAERIIEKAANFKELHIGTTLGQTHYDFAVQLVKLGAAKRRVQMLLFENRDWWYNPSVLSQLVRARAGQALQQFLIINQFAQNPERERVIYKLFSTESVVSWDEVWLLISDFSTNYFLDRFRNELKTDKRTRVQKYFRYFVARLLMKEEKWAEAQAMLADAARSTPDLDPEYEQLFLARVAEAQALIAGETDQPAAKDGALSAVAQTVPQLLPFSGIKLGMRLRTSGAVDAKLVGRMKDCNIAFEETGALPTAYLNFIPAGPGAMRVEYRVENASGKLIVSRQRCSYKTVNSSRAGVDMAYRLFGIGGL